MTESDFDKTITVLGSLAENPEHLGKFIEVYEKTLNGIYADLLLVKNVGKAYQGTYTARAEVLASMLNRMCQTMGIERPTLPPGVA